jgi:hypothetical protein
MQLSEVKKNMHKSVLYDGSVYWLQSCVMWLDEKNNEFKYSLVLVDKSRNSTVDVPIEKVGVIEEGYEK